MGHTSIVLALFLACLAGAVLMLAHCDRCNPATRRGIWLGLLIAAAVAHTHSLTRDSVDGELQLAVPPIHLHEYLHYYLGAKYYAEIGHTPLYEAIVIASLIEAEAGVDEDRPLIASVIYNRLDRGQALQIDATVQYALPERKARLTFEDLEVDSPYNTYQIVGLPPTPIATPSLASLEAAAAPSDTEFLFYVLADESGRHAFAETAEEFEELVAQARRDGILPP